MEATIKVSVIIPVYNTELYLREAIDSIVNQTLKDIEIIIVNDGSTDNSDKIIEEYAQKDPRIKVITQENQGLSISRNNGLKEAVGEYIYFMDSDDLLEFVALKESYEKCKEENLDFVIFNAESFGCENIPEWYNYEITKYIKPGIKEGYEIMNTLLDNHKYRSSVCLLLINNKLLKEKKLNFYPGILHEDELFTTILFLCSIKVDILDKIYFKRRLRPNSITSTKFSKRNLNGYITILTELKIKRSTYTHIKRNILNKYIAYTLNIVLRNAWQLNIQNRLRFAYWSIINFAYLVQLKSLCILLFKKLVK